MKILIAGDSFTYGQGCKDRFYYVTPQLKVIGNPDVVLGPPSKYCWASLLQRQYHNYEVINYGKPGRDIVHISTQLIDNIDNDTELVILMGTTVNRFQVEADIGEVESPFPIVVGNQRSNFTKEYRNALDDFTKYLYNESYFTDVYINAIRSVYSYCLSRNIKFLWSYVDDDFLCAYSEKDIPKKFNRRCEDISHLQIPSLTNYFSNRNSSILRSQNPNLASCGHANELGHRVFYDKEIKPRMENILVNP